VTCCFSRDDFKKRKMGEYYRDEHSFRFVLFFFLALIIFAYFIFVMGNSYRIVWKGLWKLYAIWCSQLVYLIILLTISFSRPIWAPETNDKIWNNNTLCSITGRVWSFVLLGTNVFVTLFSYYKALLYFKLVWTRRQCLKSFFQISVWGYVISVMASIILMPTGPRLDNSYQVCIHISSQVRILHSINSLIYIVINGVMCVCFWFYSDMSNPFFLDFEHQLQINKKIVPIMFISTILLSMYALIYTSTLERDDTSPYIVVMCQLVDNFINNIVMYYTLFCGTNVEQQTNDEAEFLSRMDFMIQQRNETNEDMIVHTGDEPEADCFVWVSLPGLHPIRLLKSLVEEYDLQDEVITNAKLLKQIEKYQTRGFIPSLLSCCRSPHDFEAAIDGQNQPDLPNVRTAGAIHVETKPVSTKPVGTPRILSPINVEITDHHGTFE